MVRLSCVLLIGSFVGVTNEGAVWHSAVLSCVLLIGSFVGVTHEGAVWRSAVRCVAVCCNVLQCIAVRCGVLVTLHIYSVTHPYGHITHL